MILIYKRERVAKKYLCITFTYTMKSITTPIVNMAVAGRYCFVTCIELEVGLMSFYFIFHNKI